MVWRRCRAFATAVHEARCLPGDDEVVVMEDATPEAYALPGLPGRIVVSTGMLGALDDRQRDVLVAHERAHLTCHHYAFVAVAQLAATANPLLRPLATAVGYTVERWADECAATATGDRHLTAHAIATAALAANRSRGRGPALALGLFGPRSALATAGPVPRRVAALLAPPLALTRRRLLFALVVLALAAVTCLFALEAAHDLHGLLEMASTNHPD
jgi:Zn-dependent protease with chaperone function